MPGYKVKLSRQVKIVETVEVRVEDVAGPEEAKQAALDKAEAYDKAGAPLGWEESCVDQCEIGAPVAEDAETVDPMFGLWEERYGYPRGEG